MATEAHKSKTQRSIRLTASASGVVGQVRGSGEYFIVLSHRPHQPDVDVELDYSGQMVRYITVDKPLLRLSMTLGEGRLCACGRAVGADRQAVFG